MELNELLGIGDFMLVESSYAEQNVMGKTLDYLSKVKEEDVLETLRIYAESKELIGIAIHDTDLGFWVIFTDIIADKWQRENFVALASAIKGAKERKVTVTTEKFREGLMAFYSLGLVNRLFCDCDLNLKEECFYPRDRVESLKKVLSRFLSDKDGIKNTLEIGCGDGGATIALHESGIFPITIDVNKCEICKGVEAGVLEPTKSVVLDCSVLPAYFDREFDAVFGFMVGKLTPSELFTWEKVLREVPKVLKPHGQVLFTVSSEEETVILNEILKDDFEAEILENKDSNGYFDLWLYMGTLRD
ncbi:MAG: class I SAM-dependent methyltransferase [Methanosarcinales archaeon]